MTLKDMVCKNSYDLYKYLKDELDNVNEDYKEVLKDRKVIKKFLFFKTVHYKESGTINNPKSIYMKHKGGKYERYLKYHYWSDIYIYIEKIKHLINQVNEDYIVNSRVFSTHSLKEMKQFIIDNKLIETDNLDDEISDMIANGDYNV